MTVFISREKDYRMSTCREPLKVLKRVQSSCNVRYVLLSEGAVMNNVGVLRKPFVRQSCVLVQCKRSPQFPTDLVHGDSQAVQMVTDAHLPVPDSSPVLRDFQAVQIVTDTRSAIHNSSPAYGDFQEVQTVTDAQLRQFPSVQ